MSGLPAIGLGGDIPAGCSTRGRPTADEANDQHGTFGSTLGKFEREAAPRSGTEERSFSEENGFGRPPQALGAFPQARLFEADLGPKAIDDTQLPIAAGTVDLHVQVQAIEMDAPARRSSLAVVIADHLGSVLGPERPAEVQKDITIVRSVAREGAQTIPISAQWARVDVQKAPAGRAENSLLPGIRITRHQAHLALPARFDAGQGVVELEGTAGEAKAPMNRLDESRLARSQVVIGRAGDIPIARVQGTHANGEGAPLNVTALQPDGAGPSAATVRAAGAGSPEVEAGARVEQAPSIRPELMQINAGPLRVLHVQLQPVELGQVEIRLRAGADGSLAIHIEAERRETSALLQQDRELIAGILRKIGHPVETVMIGASPQSDGAGSEGEQLQGGRAGAKFAGADAGADQSPRGQPPSSAGQQESSGARDDQDLPPLAVRRRDSLYL